MAKRGEKTTTGRTKKEKDPVEIQDNTEVEVQEEVQEEEVPVEEEDKSAIERINESVNDIVGEEVAVKRDIDLDAIDPNELIQCTSVVFGGLTWVSSKTNAHYRWGAFGESEYIPFGELVTLNNTNRNFLFTPLFIVQDQRVADYFRLNEVYERVAEIQNFENVLSKGLDEVEKVVEVALMVNMRDPLLSKVRQLRKTGKLTNIDVIKLLEKKLCFDLSEV